MLPSSVKARQIGALVGLAVGDAVGTTVEFKPRGSFEPLTDMVGGGPFRLPVGAWTDDMSMALCLGHSLVAHNGFEAADQMARYWDWYQKGYMSSTGVCFDIGNTVRAALERYQASGEPMSGATDPMSAGNGSLMRLAPVAIFYYPDVAAMMAFAAESSRTTHGAPEAVAACRLFAFMLAKAFAGAGKEEILGAAGFETTVPKIAALARGGYREKEWAEIQGTGYVVASLEAALYCFAQAGSYETAVLTAANLGDDADTTAAICGQLAGAYYGVEGIPLKWRQKLVMHEAIVALAGALMGDGER